MLEWLAIIALAAGLLWLRARVDSLEAHEASLRSTIAELRARLLAVGSAPRAEAPAVPAPPSEAAAASRAEPIAPPEPLRAPPVAPPPAHTPRPEVLAGSPYLSPEVAAALRRPPGQPQTARPSVAAS